MLNIYVESYFNLGTWNIWLRTDPLWKYSMNTGFTQIWILAWRIPVEHFPLSTMLLECCAKSLWYNGFTIANWFVIIMFYRKIPFFLPWDCYCHNWRRKEKHMALRRWNMYYYKYSYKAVIWPLKVFIEI